MTGATGPGSTGSTGSTGTLGPTGPTSEKLRKFDQTIAVITADYIYPPTNQPYWTATSGVTYNNQFTTGIGTPEQMVV